MANKLDWMVVDQKVTDRDVRADDNSYVFDLVNLTEADAIRYGERRWGINLVWTDPTKSSNIRFDTKEGGDGRISFHERIAINVKGGGFLKYESRDYGINLVWSDRPVFEWSLTNELEPPKKAGKGRQVKTNEVVGIYNHVEDDYLIYAPRPVGINLRWWRDRNKAGDVFDLGLDDLGDVVKTANKLVDVYRKVVG